MTRQQALDFGIKSLQRAGIDEVELGARLLLQEILRCSRIELVMNFDREIDPKDAEIFAQWIGRRCNHEPIQHIMGYQAFMGYDFKVTRDTLIPRPETEELVALALSLVREDRAYSILDMGTGTGCIPISLCLLDERICCTGVDFSEKALAVAEENARRHQMTDRVSFRQSDLFASVERMQYDLVISNPPYISVADMNMLERQVKAFEPESALVGGEDGLYFYRSITQQAGAYLKTGGYLLYEIGYDQRNAVTAMMEAAGFSDVQGLKDMSGRDRIVYGRKSDRH